MTYISTLFGQLGHLFGTAAAENTAALTTLPAEYANILTDLAALPALSVQANQGQAQIQGSLDGAANVLGSIAGQLIVSTMAANVTLPNTQLFTALSSLVTAMLAGADYVTGNAPSYSGQSPIGSPASLLVLTLCGGQWFQDQLAETWTVTVTGQSGNVSVVGAPPAPISLGYQWPGGSGVNASLSPITPANSIVANGSFDIPSALDANVPASWSVVVGTPGTSIKLSTISQQSLTISGSPTGGYYYIVWEDADSVTQQTGQIPWNASSAQIQFALNALNGLGGVTVGAQTGTAPNLACTITFNGIAGPTNALTLGNNQMSGGSSPTVTFASVTAGTPAYSGLALSFIGTAGGESTEIIQPVTIQPNTMYAVCFAAIKQSGISAGTITIDLIDGTTGAVLVDIGTGDMSMGIPEAPLSSVAWQLVSNQLGIAPTPAIVPQNVCLRIRASTHLTSAKYIALDYLTLVPIASLYPGGPGLAVFPGVDPAGAGPCYIGDQWTVALANTLSNSGAPGFQSWFDRAFGMRQLGLVLPTTGSNLLADSLIA